MTPGDAALLFASAVAGGAINSVAGGGSFFTFPALVFTGMPSIAANATSTMAVWPGSLASVAAYRDDVRAARRHLPGLLAMSLAGGLVGALVLLRTPQPVFDRLLPWLLLFATAVFAFGQKFTAWLKRHETPGAPGRVGALSWTLQFLIAIYGGYFGGGMGLMMLAMLTLAGLTDIHEMNGIKTVLASALNAIALVAFIWAGLVQWPQASVMIVGAVLGGYGGARLAKRVDPAVVRGVVIAVGCLLTAWFFGRA
jgi:uncharacterized protein